MSTIDELRRERAQLREQNAAIGDDQRRELEHRIARLERRLYEAGPDHRRWMRLHRMVEPQFTASVDAQKPVFEFVRMILTTSLVVAVTVFVANQPASADDTLFSNALWAIGFIGLAGMNVLLILGSLGVA